MYGPANKNITGAFIQQTHTRAQKNLKKNAKRSRKSFSVRIPLQLEESEWMLRLTS